MKRIAKPATSADAGTYVLMCPVCQHRNTYEVGTPFPPVSTLQCSNCGQSQAKEVLEAVMSDQDTHLKKLQHWMLLVSIPSLSVLVAGIWILISKTGGKAIQTLGIGMILFSVVLLALSMSFAGTLAKRRQMLRKLATEKGYQLHGPQSPHPEKPE